jgi:hypothetical protein
MASIFFKALTVAGSFLRLAAALGARWQFRKHTLLEPPQNAIVLGSSGQASCQSQRHP